MGEAAADGYVAARRFAAGNYARSNICRSLVAKGYEIQSRARFRIDRHQWEPDVTIRNVASSKHGVAQVFGGATSPFMNVTFESEQVAVEYGLAYGERLVLRVIGGLRI